MEDLNSFEALCHLLEKFPTEANELHQFVVKTVWTKDDKHCILNRVAKLMLNPLCTLKVAEFFSSLLLDLLNRCISQDGKENLARHESLCIALGKLIWLFPEAARFAYFYFERSSHILARYIDKEEGKPSAAKRSRDDYAEEEMIITLLTATLQFFAFDLSYFRDLWDWSVLVAFLKLEDEDVKWLTHQCIFRISNISNREQNVILQETMSESDILKFESKYSQILSHMWDYEPLNQGRSLSPDEDMEKDSCVATKKISFHNISCSVVNVQGVLLQKINSTNEADESLVLTESVQQCLQQLALAISSGVPVLIQGPVGCGKTSLVEYLANLTGRKASTDVLKIQLGDQTDSKLLLGSYCCTEIPGEFVWQPGILTQAMVGGHWLLLEDIDCAPVDIISMLTPIIQTQSLVLPGHATPVKAQTGFQLFATQRLLVSHGKTYMSSRNNAEVLNKMWRKITIQDMSKDELKAVISKKWKVLTPILDRILKIFSLFSSCSDSVANGSIDSSKGCNDPSPFASSNHRGRLISTRDLFKFCKRAVKGFDIHSVDTSLRTFQIALDCFCDSLPNLADRIHAAELIGVHFGMPKQKASFYCIPHKLGSTDSEKESFQIGRATLPIREEAPSFMRHSRMPFASTKQAAYLLQKVAVAITEGEPVLLVGETGTGKTSVVQYLAQRTNNSLTVINMNQQSDSIDLLGGYKPVDMKLVIIPLKEEFLSIFPKTFSEKQNTKFLGHITKCYLSKNWVNLFTLMLHSQNGAVQRLTKKSERTAVDNDLLKRWKKLGRKLVQLKLQLQHTSSPLAFSFIEGALVKAMKKGEWILLDEINLAEAETLQCLSGILESNEESVLLLEKGDKKPVKRHEDFRVFACMNPATDVGKKDLPVGIRNRFTEVFVDELNEKDDLTTLVESYLCALALDKPVVENIVNFYVKIQREATRKLNDGVGHHPHYSLRTLCRALSYASKNPCGCVPRSLYEAFALSFLSQLDEESYEIVDEMIKKFILGKNRLSVLKQKIREPTNGSYVPIQDYWISAGDLTPSVPEKYIITKSVQKNLHDLARIVSAGRYPVLLQGETSVGKTSLVTWLAQTTGNHCVRVNNHEHTDIQEYIGSYCADQNGKLFFKEGVLIEAMRKGYWIILDELNLAPTEVMEALNRVLDDNRELFVMETQEMVKAHKKFMVFATQNPPGLYGGRKVLSRAFRNRFIELHFNEIPPNELEVILADRCAIPPSYSRKMVTIMQELQLRRRESGVFAGKHGYATLRDLFRWGERYRLAAKEDDGKFYDWLQHVADEGYLLLAGKVRRPEEAKVIQDVIQKHMKRKIDPESLFSFDEGSLTTRDVAGHISDFSLGPKFKHISWTQSIRKLAVLVGKALRFGEPVLLIGNTGCGKTTICQIFAELYGKKLYTVNCHMHSESSDFLGNLRPVRVQEEKNPKLFEWTDGPLVTSMMNGDFFLADEISLADDSVLERLNSVLEPERMIRITEKSDDSEDETVITAEKGFCFMATMNPGGDYGKKELSPALRNRFTEIWCPSDLKNQELVEIIEHNIKDDVQFGRAVDSSGFGHAMMSFLNWFLTTEVGKRVTLSVRDILKWVDFINVMVSKPSSGQVLSPEEAFVHGACLVFLDCLGSSSVCIGDMAKTLRIEKASYNMLVQLVEAATDKDFRHVHNQLLKSWNSYSYVNLRKSNREDFFGIGPFSVPTGHSGRHDVSEIYKFDTPSTKCNVLRLLRAMQLREPILLEGNPGVGKTSLLTVLGKAAGYQVVRINLSEQTDVSDLFGSDLPVDGGECGQFAWRDGPLLRAVKNGSWILLDELNLASQSVLEGLNACLDHRGEIYVPELGKTFSVPHKSSRIFGCQNPFKQGGSRKGLPRSFLNRFTQVYMKPFSSADLKCIASSLNSAIPTSIVSDMVDFNEKIVAEINLGHLCPRDGHLWPFNLRDIFRWCEVMISDQLEQRFNPVEYVSLLYADRMRTDSDKEKVMELCKSHFGIDEKDIERYLQLTMSDAFVQVGHSFVNRKDNSSFDCQMLYPLRNRLHALESFMKCIEMNWMPILVGPPASGKSAMVRLLASITGHTLKVLTVNSEMDTTELIGGFEQTDLNRHVDYVVEDLEPLVQGAVAQCLIGAEDIPDRTMRQMLTCILSRLYTLRNMKCQKAAMPVSDEVSICRQKIKSILEIVKVMENLEMEDSEALSVVKQNVIGILDKLETSGHVSTGGRFEWVNSVLVQAVQKGYWLMIEDVNFCSPSVLDRLNGLLEPCGVLTLTEQGIVGNEIIEIEPHPEFRIILTMDPRNGEISPAMRNRGVEVALPREFMDYENKEPSYFWDVCALFRSRGISDRKVMHSLLRCYTTLRVADSDHSSPYSILNVASLCLQNLQKNRSLQEALQSSFSTGVLNNISDEVMRKKCCGILKEDLQKLPEYRQEVALYHNQQQQYTDVGPTFLDFQHSHASATAIQQSCIFSSLIKEFLKTVLKISEVHSPLSFHGPVFTYPHASAIDEWIRVFACGMRVVFESCSVNQWKMFSFWLKGCLKDYLVEFDEDSEEHECIQKVFTALLKIKKMQFDTFLGSPMTKELITHVDSIVGMYMEIEKDDIPIDPRWNTYLFRRLLTKLLKNERDNFNVHQHSYVISAVANRFLLLLNLSLMNYLDNCGDNTDYIYSVESQKMRSSLRGLSISFNKGQLSMQALPHPFIANIDRFITRLSNAIVNSLTQSSSSCSKQGFWEIWKSLNVYQQFLRFCNKPIGTQSFEDHIEVFLILWRRLIKNMANFFRTGDGSTRIPPDVVECMRQISQDLGDENNGITKLRYRLSKFFGFTSPFRIEGSAKLGLEIMDIHESIDIYKVMRSPDRREHLKIILTNGSKWNAAMVSAALKCLEGSEELADVSSAVHLIKLQLCDAGLKADDDDDIMEVCQQPLIPSNVNSSQLSLHIELLPLYDYFFVQAEACFLAETGKSLFWQLCSSNKVPPSSNSMFSREWANHLGFEKLYLNPFHISRLNSLSKDKNKKYFAVCLSSFFSHIRNGPSSVDQDFCINWQQNEAVQKQSNMKLSWGKQYPLLSSICLSLFNSMDPSGKMSFSLENFLEKSDQIRRVRDILWKNWDSLGCQTFKESAVKIILSWYNTLVAAMTRVADVKPQDDIKPRALARLCNQLGLLPVLQLQNTNVLLEACNSIQNITAESVQGVNAAPESDWPIGRSCAFIGMTTMLLFAVRDSVDPALKKDVKLNSFREESKNIFMEWSFRDWQCRAISGMPLLNVKQDCHTYVAELPDIGSEIKIKRKTLQSKLIYRSSPSQFKQLKIIMQHFLNTTNLAALSGTLVELDPSRVDNSDLATLSMLTDNFEAKLTGFISSVYPKFALYEDLLYPFVTGAEMLLLGLQMMTKCLTRCISRKNAPSNVNLDHLMIEICSFPTLSVKNLVHTPLQLASTLLSQSSIDAVCSMCSGGTQPSHNEVTVSMLKSALLELLNQTVILKRESVEDVLTLANVIFDRFSDIWKHQNEALRLKKELDESLFEQKTRSYCTDPNEDVAFAREVKALFPSYDEDYKEFLPAATDDETELPSNETSKSTADELLNPADMFELWSCHSTLISKLMLPESDSSNPMNHVVKKMDKPDFLSAFLLRYKLLKLIVPSLTSFDSAIDVHLVGSHVLAATSSFDLKVNMTNNKDSVLPCDAYDIYHDSNAKEVIPLIPLLKAIAERVNILLKKYPENPLLVKVFAVVDRILSFPVSAPVLKFVIGLELVLESAQLWEQNAPKELSLQPQLEAISDRIIHFRKMELMCWKQCLDSVVKKQYTDCAVWWFHLYSSIFHSSLNTNALGSVLKILQQFMEDSSLGQFVARLGLLQTFAQYLKLMATTKLQRKIRNLLFNVYAFYAQFMTAIVDKIQDVRKPVEDELKDFVKISRWNDKNFYSLKNLVKKSHQTVLKCMKKFETALGQPARLYFHVQSRDNAGESQPWSLNIARKEFSSMVDMSFVNYEESAYTEVHDSLYHDLPHYYRRARKLCKRTVGLFPVLHDVNTLNEFAGDIIIAVKELQSLAVRKNVPEEARKKDAKSIFQQRKKALADLFKKLASIGLSYRKGLIHYENSATADGSFNVPAIDVELFGRYESMCSSSSSISSCISGMDHYYYKCVAQYSMLEKCMQSPNKVLNEITVVQRCKGFAGDLFQRVIAQRQSLAADFEKIAKFSEAVNSLHSLILAKDDEVKKLVKGSQNTYSPPQDVVLHWKSQLCTLLTQAVVAFQQFEILLTCCPSDHKCPMVNRDAASDLAQAVKGGKVVSDMACNVQSSIGEIKEIISAVLQTFVPVKTFRAWSDLAVIHSSLKSLYSVIEKFQNSHCKHFLKKYEQDQGFSDLAEFLSCVHDAASEKLNEFSRSIGPMYKLVEKDENVLKEESQRLVRTSEKLLLKVLKSIENFFTFTTERQSSEITDDIAPDVVPDKLFSEKILTCLSKSGECLRIRRIAKCANKVLDCVRELEKSPAHSALIEKYVMNVVPVLSQYTQLQKLYVVASLASHRTSCKLLSVLLGIFIDLSQKGFCIPTELMPDMDKSGAVEFQDIEQGGFGDGSGLKDVSKDIKTEDQLDDAMKEGTEEKENDASDIKDEEDGIEMSEDFKGEMYEPESDDRSDDDEEEEEEEEENSDTEEPEIDKQMGEVEQPDNNELDEQIWGGESDDDEDELKDDDASGGVTQKEHSELVAKDGKEKELDRKKNDSTEKCPDLKSEEEYDGEYENPLIDAPPLLQPEGLDLPEDMEVDTDNDDNDEYEEGGEEEAMDETSTEEGEIDDEEENYEDGDEQEDNSAENDDQTEVENSEKDEDGNALENASDEYDEEENGSKETDEETSQSAFPTKSSTDEAQGAYDNTTSSSHDNVMCVDNDEENSEGGIQDMPEQQHGQAKGDGSRSSAAEDMGRKPSSPKSSLHEEQRRRGLRQSDEDRTLGDPTQSLPKRFKISHKKTTPDHKNDSTADEADKYEHVKDGKEDDQQALDAAAKEQTLQRDSTEKPKCDVIDVDDDDDVIALDSSSEEDPEEDPAEMERPLSGAVISKKRQLAAAASGEDGAQEDIDATSEGEFVKTLGVKNLMESTIHTQRSLWSQLAEPEPRLQKLRKEIKEKLDVWFQSKAKNSDASLLLWQSFETAVFPLVQELCEQLRLVLEPTKMTKLKGDYRTGKRLNMRKIIPYIASQFRKDKIWLRRTKPSKREYEIMLAVDDSLSMVNGNTRQLAFESLALLGKCLTFLETGDMSVVSFGKDVKLLHEFGKPFTDSAAASILESFTFDQPMTIYGQLIEYATSTMVRSRNMPSKHMSKEFSQLLIIISDGRGIFTGGEPFVRRAIRQAHACNVFIVFVLLDTPSSNSYSVLDMLFADFDERGEPLLSSYMEKFPFPFYVVLKNIESLPHILGEALRQWFELVTSAEH